MPRKGNRKNTSGNSLLQSELESESSKLGAPPCRWQMSYLEMEIKDKFQELFEELEETKNFALNGLKISFENSLLLIPENLLNLPIDINDKNLERMLSNSISENYGLNADNISQGTVIKTAHTTALKRRRSRSVQPVHYDIKKMNTTKRRSSSLNLYKTPANKVWLEALTSAKKYTVSKPKRDDECGISLKRFIRPDEEAISVTGSPLLVQPVVASAPTIHIPLPGGVVMNILPKRPRGQFEVPEFDEATRQQLKLLYEQLEEMV